MIPDCFWAALLAALILRSIGHSLRTTAVLLLPGTVLHEVAHWLVGWLLLADPDHMSILPKKDGHMWILGSVTFRNIRWFNGLFVGTAPLLLLPAAWWFSTQIQWDQHLLVALPWFYLAAAVLASCWPSSADWHIAFADWPAWILLIVGVLLTWHYGKPFLSNWLG